MATEDTRQFETKNTDGQDWKTPADELRKTSDVERTRELVMLLEEAIFNRQQELTLNAGKIREGEIEDEERALNGALDLMLEIKVKILGFPAV